MAGERHTTAFVVGFVLGGVAGAAVTLWRTPRSGGQARQVIAEQAEEFLFRLTGMNEAESEGASSGTLPPPFETPGAGGGEAFRAAVVTPPIPIPQPDSLEAAVDAPIDEDDGSPLPTTFRGEVLTEKPADIVLDLPRPGPPDH